MLHLPSDYENVYIVCYPPGSGGNFLINCLALDDNFVFSNSTLARRQLDGQFGIEEKISYLHHKLTESVNSRRWFDLDLGNGHLFGILGNELQSHFPEILGFRINSIINDIIDLNKGFFWICHNILDIPILKQQIWPRAKIIFFSNYRTFLHARPEFSGVDTQSNDLHAYWQTIRDESWPESPPINMEQLYQLPAVIRQEIIHDFKFEIARWLDLTKETDIAWQNRIDLLSSLYQTDSVIWSVDENYSNEEQLIRSLRLLCQKFDFQSMPETDIVEYYRSWRHAIACCTR